MWVMSRYAVRPAPSAAVYQGRAGCCTSSQSTAATAISSQASVRSRARKFSQPRMGPDSRYASSGSGTSARASRRPPAVTAMTAVTRATVGQPPCPSGAADQATQAAPSSRAASRGPATDSTPTRYEASAPRVGAVTGGSVTGGSVTGGSVTGGSVTGGSVTGGSVTGGSVTGGSVTGGSV